MVEMLKVHYSVPFDTYNFNKHYTVPFLDLQAFS